MAAFPMITSRVLFSIFLLSFFGNVGGRFFHFSDPCDVWRPLLGKSIDPTFKPILPPISFFPGTTGMNECGSVFP